MTKVSLFAPDAFIRLTLRYCTFPYLGNLLMDYRTLLDSTLPPFLHPPYLSSAKCTLFLELCTCSFSVFITLKNKKTSSISPTPDPTQCPPLQSSRSLIALHRKRLSFSFQTAMKLSWFTMTHVRLNPRCHLPTAALTPSTNF